MPRLSFLPRSLYGRAALILIVPIVTIQLVVSITFIQRHFERVTEQMTESVAREVRLLRSEVDSAPSLAEARARLAAMTRPLAISSRLPATAVVPGGDQVAFYDLSGKVLIRQLRLLVPDIGPVDLLVVRNGVRTTVATDWGTLQLTVDRGRLSASNPHQLLVLMLVTSALMTVIAFLFLSNQLRPIKQMADAADAFGKGQTIPFRPRGATEVRAAGLAFLDMRARIERQIEQRTLLLSGISHDLRTPLTRLKLGLSLMPEDDDTRALQGDVVDMERLVDEFLSFVRGDATEESVTVDPFALVSRVIENAERAGQAVVLAASEGQGMVTLRAQAVARAVENLIGNAVRHGTCAEVSVILTERSLKITVEDDGPGIPSDKRDEAMTAFARLDVARDPNRGGGVGLGLTIAADIARSHGGSLRLGDSARLGGLRADLTLMR
ncbi:MAG: two-component sensor histidine kinase [Rhodobacteraceae bacterium PARR1]|nr:MAG: two-component sensor histidine kinase [Rhodobacteraceae bacterium PARR1]